MVEIKYFTPEEANKTLPLVKQIVFDILQKGREIKILSESFIDDEKTDNVIESLTKEIDSYIDELKEIGCYYKDWNFEIGLIDFPAIIDDEEVMLCWKSDEPEIKYYHRLNDGFIGRKEIPSDHFN